MKKFLFLLIVAMALLGTTVTRAQSFESGNFNFRISYGEAEVTGLTSSASSLTTITIPGFVTYNGTVYQTRIGSMAFASNTTLQRVYVNYGCTRVGQQAFANCTALTNLRLPSSINYMGSQIVSGAGSSGNPIVVAMAGQSVPATFSASALTGHSGKQITFIVSTYRAYNAFHGNSTVANQVDYWIQMGNMAYDYQRSGYNGYYVVTEMATGSTPGAMMLVDCSNSSSAIHVPSNGTLDDGRTYNITAVADSAFMNKSTVESFTWTNAPAGSRIGGRAFANVPTLTTVNTNAETFDHYAFTDCQNLTNLTLGSGVKEIQYRVFKNSGITSMSFPETLTNFDPCSLDDCSNFASFSVASGNTKYAAQNGILYNKDLTTLVKCPPGITSVPALPHTLLKIGYYAFSGMTKGNGLTIDIPFGVTTIGQTAFQYSTAIENIRIPSSYEPDFGSSMFYGCSGLKNLAINSINPIGYSNALWYDVPRSSCTLWVAAGDSYWDQNWTHETYAGDYNRDIFREFSNVKVGAYDVVVGGLPYTLDKEHGTASVVRGECGYIFPTSQLSGAISIPMTITYEGTTYTVTSVNRQAFRNNTAITSVTIPETVTELCGVIAGYAGNESDTEVYRRSGSQFEGCTALTSVRLSSKITRIPIRCFYNTPISQIELPYGLQEIGYQAFSGTNITSLTIPSSTTKLHRALSGMTHLQHLYYNRTDPDGLFRNWGQLGETETGYVPSGFNLYVPVGYVQQFENNSRVMSKAASVQAGAYDIYCNSKYFTVNSDGQTSKLVYSPAYATGLSQVNINQICYDGWTRIYNCTALGDSCFAGSNVQAVQIATDFPSKVIPRYAFMNCTRLNNIGFLASHGVTQLGECAFQNCAALSGTIILPETLRKIGRRAFFVCDNISAIYTHDETWEDDALYVGTSTPRTMIYVPLNMLAARLDAMPNWTSSAGKTEYYTHPYLRNTGGPQLISCPEHLSMQAACDFYAVTGYNAARKVFTTQKVNGNVFRNCGKESNGRGVLVDNLASDYVPLKVAKSTSDIQGAQSWSDVTNLIMPMAEGGNLSNSSSNSDYILDGANNQFNRIMYYPHAFNNAEAYVRIARTATNDLNTVGLDLYSIPQGEERYDLVVLGDSVTSTNCDDILGDGTMSYDPTTNVLTMNNVYIEDATHNVIIISDIHGLKINLIGTNYIYNYSSNGLCLRLNSCTTTFTGDGELYLTSPLGTGGNGVELRSSTLNFTENVKVHVFGVNYALQGSTLTSGVGGVVSVSGNAHLEASCTMSGTGAMIDLQDLIMNDNIGIIKPVGGSFVANSGVVDANGSLAKNVEIGKTSTAVPGDVNGDGSVTASDVTAIYNYLLNNDDSALVNGDQNGDGYITAADVTIVYNIMLGS